MLHVHPPRGHDEIVINTGELAAPSEVFISLASPLTPLKSPLYQSGPDGPSAGRTCRVSRRSGCW